MPLSCLSTTVIVGRGAVVAVVVVLAVVLPVDCDPALVAAGAEAKQGGGGTPDRALGAGHLSEKRDYFIALQEEQQRSSSSSSNNNNNNNNNTNLLIFVLTWLLLRYTVEEEILEPLW